ncbi:periplasmic protein [Serratia phage CHI14]|uniref:Uncharacterized protein n=2 Tax=Winklervirus chi14 TaxID=2560752 RepID=A0A1Z1LYR9_9CAUD|nr:periplasmic protein [Serratia phage CHI14]ARW57693.1 hypothetical protein [Serratia phage CHI14]ARW57968.1 hypothetical protein [Serratia phage CBH8]UJJ22268.1 hypothetical protein [Erwinia phage Virsaitis27]
MRKNFGQSRQSQSWMWKLFPWFFGFVFFMIVAGIAAEAYVLYVAVDAIKEEGLKSVVEVIWNGQEK